MLQEEIKKVEQSIRHPKGELSGASYAGTLEPKPDYSYDEESRGMRAALIHGVGESIARGVIEFVTFQYKDKWDGTACFRVKIETASATVTQLPRMEHGVLCGGGPTPFPVEPDMAGERRTQSLGWPWRRTLPCWGWVDNMTPG